MRVRQSFNRRLDGGCCDGISEHRAADGRLAVDGTAIGQRHRPVQQRYRRVGPVQQRQRRRLWGHVRARDVAVPDIQDPVHNRVHNRAGRQHAGHLRGDPVLQDADCDQHVHRKPGHRRRVFPDWHTVPDRHHVHGVLAVRQRHVQGVHDHDQRQPVHQQHIPDDHERRPVHSHMPSDIVVQGAHRIRVQNRLGHRMDVQHHTHDTGHHVRQHHGQGQRHELQHHMARERPVQRADGVHALLVRPRIRYTANAHIRLLHTGHQETANGTYYTS